MSVSVCVGGGGAQISSKALGNVGVLELGDVRRMCTCCPSTCYAACLVCSQHAYAFCMCCLMRDHKPFRAAAQAVVTTRLVQWAVTQTVPWLRWSHNGGSPSAAHHSHPPPISPTPVLEALCFILQLCNQQARPARGQGCYGGQPPLGHCRGNAGAWYGLIPCISRMPVVHLNQLWECLVCAGCM